MWGGSLQRAVWGCGSIGNTVVFGAYTMVHARPNCSQEGILKVLEDRTIRVRTYKGTTRSIQVRFLLRRAYSDRGAENMYFSVRFLRVLWQFDLF